MDQGVIKSLKSKYRTKVFQQMINAIHNDEPLPTISVIEVKKMLIFASTARVQSCFKKAGFSVEEKDDDPNDPFSTLKHSMEQL